MTHTPKPNGELWRMKSGEMKLRCPGCGHWGEIDDDQLYGRVSVNHTTCPCGCTFHETREWHTTADWADSYSY